VSEYTALRETSQALTERVRLAFLADPQLNPLFGAGGHVVSLRTPREMRGGQPPEVGLSVWLYQVERNEFLYNRPPERVDALHVRRSPLPVNLHYLVTPITSDPAIEQLILGKVLQVLHDGAIIPPDPANPELEDELRVTLENLDVESITRVWTALDEPYQLCTSYLVQAVNIRSGEEPAQVAPVLVKTSEYNQIVGTS
jgi:hypothetical protein